MSVFFSLLFFIGLIITFSLGEYYYFSNIEIRLTIDENYTDKLYEHNEKLIYNGFLFSPKNLLIKNSNIKQKEVKVFYQTKIHKCMNNKIVSIEYIYTIYPKN